MEETVNQTGETKVDNLAKFGPTFQAKVLASLLSSPDFLHQSLDVLNPKFFESNAGQWIISETVEYFTEYKSLPTLEVFKLKLEPLSDETLKIAVKEQLRSAYQRKNDEDLEYVKDSFMDFAKNQAIKSAIITSVDLLQVGRYGEIKELVDKALRAGQPRNIGHNWKEDFEIRLSGESRMPVPTGWEAIDTIIGGGLSAGEIGVIAAPSGVGKCVDGDVEIDIQYEEYCIELDGEDVWFAPWDFVNINGRDIRGWQLLTVLKLGMS